MDKGRRALSGFMCHRLNKSLRSVGAHELPGVGGVLSVDCVAVKIALVGKLFSNFAGGGFELVRRCPRLGGQGLDGNNS